MRIVVSKIVFVGGFSVYTVCEFSGRSMYVYVKKWKRVIGFGFICKIYGIFDAI